MEVHAKRHHVDLSGQQLVVKIRQKIHAAREPVLADIPAVVRSWLKSNDRGVFPEILSADKADRRVEPLLNLGGVEADLPPIVRIRDRRAECRVAAGYVWPRRVQEPGCRLEIL